MKIHDVTVHNWQPPGPAWWRSRDDRPDEPLIEATMKLTLSSNEYQQMLREHQKTVAEERVKTEPTQPQGADNGITNNSNDASSKPG